MLLKGKYYRLTNMHQESTQVLFHVELLSECDVYLGHFPGNPVCPGVCNIELIRECAETWIGSRLYINSIKQCRLTAIASPSICRELDVAISMEKIEGGFNVTAKIHDANKVYMNYKGSMLNSLA